MADMFFERIVAHLKTLPSGRRSNLIEAINDRIRETGSRRSDIDDVPMAALARRLFFYALQRGADAKVRSGGSRKSGPTTPQYKVMEEEIEDFRSRLLTQGVHGIDPLGDKDLEHLCTHKVYERGSSRLGFYVLCALYVLQQEEAGQFDLDKYLSLIPVSEVNLAYEIGTFFARRMNEDAEALKDPVLPFPGTKRARPPSGYSRVSFYYLQHEQHARAADELFEQYRVKKNNARVAGDDNAHFIVYRCRQSDASELMKSFLVIKPAYVNPRDPKDRYHPTFHIYRAPKKVGNKRRASPGRILPLDSGLFIIAGQRPGEMLSTETPSRDPGLPFRTLEVMCFPWKSFETSHLFPGLALTVNNTGIPMLTRICARPTALCHSDAARLGSVGLSDLEADLVADFDAEREHIPESASEMEHKFLSVFHEFEPFSELAARIAELCNNNSPNLWSIAPGFVKQSGGKLRRSDVENIIEAAFADVATTETESFDIRRHLRIPPLMSH